MVVVSKVEASSWRKKNWIGVLVVGVIVVLHFEVHYAWGWVVSE